MTPPSPMPPAAGWLAGAASLPFPVPRGTPLDGYLARDGAATDTLDALAVSALALALGPNRLTLITADLAAVDAPLAEAVRRRLGDDAGHLLLAASHTHSGPAGVVARLHPSQADRRDPALNDRFVLACVGVAHRAWSTLQPVSLRLGQAPAPGIAANRNDPAAPTDDPVTTLAAVGGGGSTLALLVHFACHPTVLGADNLRPSADFPGALRRALLDQPRHTPRPPVVLFANGAAADLSTRFTRRAQDPAEVHRLGHLLATAATTATENARPIPPRLESDTVTISLTPRSRPTRLPVRPTSCGTTTSNPPTIDTTDDPSPPGGADPPVFPVSITDSHDDESSSSPLQPPSPPQSPAAARRRETQRQGAALLAGLDPSAVQTVAHLSAVALGDLALVTVPGELLASLGRQIVARSPFPTTVVLGYTNGYAGYLVDATAADSYEAFASPFTAGAGSALVEAAVSLLRRLYDRPGADPTPADDPREEP